MSKWLISMLARLSAGRITTIVFAGCVLASMQASAQVAESPDVTKTPTLFVVPYAHLDTQWRWEFPQVISEYLLKTMRVNFDYMDKYPHYVFNWTGSNRYMLMKEYFPDDYARIKQYAARGQWFPAGSSVEEGDVNLPDAEGIFRQILYGNTFYRQEFGKASSEYMLPDCFGFPASLPSILAHAGIKGFSTQKLNATWQPAPSVGGPSSPEQTPEGIPFNVGRWIGPDGASIIAALNPGGYTGTVFTDLSKEPGAPPARPQLSAEQLAQLTPQQIAARQRPRQWEQDWVKRIELDGRLTGVFADYHYVGTGDIGGGPPEASIKLLEATETASKTVMPPPPPAGNASPPGTPGSIPTTGTEVTVGDGPVHVIMAAADQMFTAIPADKILNLPVYQGDLELINHSAGSLTSEAYHKQQIIRNANLADAAEKASIAAAWLGGIPYQQERLNAAWRLELAGHFHDAAAGTATPRSYQFIWNDDAIAANQFSNVLASASTTVASGLDTRGAGVPIIVFNPLNISREDVVEATIGHLGVNTKSVRVYGPDGKDVKAQLEGNKVLFPANVPSVGYAVYTVEPSQTAATSSKELNVSTSSLENARYRVQLDGGGDVSSIFDKRLNKELLSAPIRFEISNDAPRIYPAWNMEYDQEQAPPRAYVSGPPQIRIKENGAVRVSLEVTRTTEGSRFVQTISLSAGDAGNRVEFSNAIDWRTLSANLKAAIPLAASNPEATYNWDVGTIQRPNAQPRQFEVASHRWIDLTDKSGSFGTTILTDCKNGSDKPSDNTIRLTLMRSPGVLPENGRPSPYTDQANQDWGHHEFTFALTGHEGGWREAQTDWQGYRLNDPPIAFETTQHPGSLGKSISLLHLSNSRVRVLALKKAEDTDEIVVRLVELNGTPTSDVKISFAAPVVAAREMNAQEQPIGKANVVNGDLVTSFAGYQPRTFAIRLGASSSRVAPAPWKPVKLDYDLATATNDDTKTPGGAMDAKGDALPAEMLPDHIDYDGIGFQLVPAATGKANAVVAKGQHIELPQGSYNRVYILAASGDGDQAATFQAGTSTAHLTVEAWNGFVGQWDNRVWKMNDDRDWATSAHHTQWPAPDMVAREGHPPSPRYPDDYVGLQPAYLKPASIAWFASHHHTPDGLNEPYQYSYLFAYSLDLPKGAHTLTLPSNANIRILAVSVADTPAQLNLATPRGGSQMLSEPADQMELPKY